MSVASVTALSPVPELRTSYQPVMDQPVLNQPVADQPVEELVRMGQLQIGETGPLIELDERALAHLKVVIFAKFRRHESFEFSWGDRCDAGGVRSSTWLQETIPIHFMFHGERPARLNRTWIDQLMVTANSPGGLRLVSEPEEQQPTGQR